MLGLGVSCYWKDLRLGTYVGGCSAVIAAIFLIIWETGSSGGWVDDLHRVTAASGPFHIAFAIAVSLGVILSARNVLAWISLGLAVLSFVATLLMDFGGEDSAVMSPFGLAGFVAAIITAHFALESDAAEDLPGWVESCLRYLLRLGGLGLIALSIVGCATNENTLGWNCAGGLIGVLFMVATNSIRRRRRWPY